RPELLAAWDRGEAHFAGLHAQTEAWQAELWRALRAHPASAGLRTLAEGLEDAADLPPPAPEQHVFGLSFVARLFAGLIGAPAAGAGAARLRALVRRADLRALLRDARRPERALPVHAQPLRGVLGGSRDGGRAAPAAARERRRARVALGRGRSLSPLGRHRDA